MRLAFVLLQTLLVGLPALGAYAQSTLDAGSVVGVLRDRTGAVVQAGIIEIKGLDAGFARSTVSDAAGRYAFDAVPPGRYSISAVAPGLERAVIKGFVVSAKTASPADFALDGARRQAFVEVTAAGVRGPARS